MAGNIQQGGNDTATLNLTNSATPPVNIPLPAGLLPVWTVDNTALGLVLTPDPTTGLTCNVAAPATGTTGSFNLIATVTYPDGDKVVATIPGNVVNAEDTQGTITWAS